MRLNSPLKNGESFSGAAQAARFLQRKQKTPDGLRRAATIFQRAVKYPSLRSVFMLTSVACLLTLIVGCGGYPEVSPGAYELAATLDQVFQYKEVKQLDQAREIIRAAAEEGKISAAEQKWFLQWVDQAAGGDWNAAQQESRRLLKDQTDW